MPEVLRHLVGVDERNVCEGIGDGGAEITDVDNDPFVVYWLHIFCG